MRALFLLPAVAASLAGASPAAAEVTQVGANGFVIRMTASVPASAEATWQALIRPRDWWDGEHSFSGDAANLSLDPRAGGCFCELLPADGKPGAKGAKPPPRGWVEYMRVIYVERPRALRMIGAIGPLQAEALTGTFTVQIKPAGASDGASGGTAILWEYVVGGFMRPQPQVVAAATDRLLAEQLARLAGKLGLRRDATPSSPEPAGPAAARPAGVGDDFLEDKTGSLPAPPIAEPAPPVPQRPPDDKQPTGR